MRVFSVLIIHGFINLGFIFKRNIFRYLKRGKHSVLRKIFIFYPSKIRRVYLSKQALVKYIRTTFEARLYMESELISMPHPRKLTLLGRQLTGGYLPSHGTNIKSCTNEWITSWRYEIKHFWRIGALGFRYRCVSELPYVRASFEFTGFLPAKMFSIQILILS